MARGCVRCTWGPSLVPKAVPSRVCVYGALRREVSGGAAGTASNCNCTACHFLAGIETGLKEKGIKRLQSRLERERERRKERKAKRKKGEALSCPQACSTGQKPLSSLEAGPSGCRCPGLPHPASPLIPGVKSAVLLPPHATCSSAESLGADPCTVEPARTAQPTSTRPTGREEWHPEVLGAHAGWGRGRACGCTLTPRPAAQSCGSGSGPGEGECIIRASPALEQQQGRPAGPRRPGPVGGGAGPASTTRKPAMGALCWRNHYAARPLCFWRWEQDAELVTRAPTRPPSQGHPKTSEGWRRKPPAASSVGPGVRARGGHSCSQQ